MTAREAGFLLLTSHLGNPERRVLTTAQLRTLAQRMKNAPAPLENRELEAWDLVKLGYNEEIAHRIVALLGEEELLQYYLARGQRAGCVPLTWVSAGYPERLRRALGLEAPGCIWAKGDLKLLDGPKISLVGSRNLREPNGEFAAEVGRQASLQGYTLVSGNARGADQTAQEACLASGGRVVSLVADSLESHKERENLLYLSEDAFDEGFSAPRALSRNRCIHALGEKTLVAQCSYQQGGTWDGSVKNLRFGWSGLFCFDDGSPAVELLHQMGAEKIGREALTDLNNLEVSQRDLWSR